MIRIIFLLILLIPVYFFAREVFYSVWADKILKKMEKDKDEFYKKRNLK